MTPEQRIEALEDRVAILEDALGITYRGKREWRLTPSQTTVLGVLLKTDVAPKERIYAALYMDADNFPDDHVIAVHVSHLRKKLAKMGVQINSVLGTASGYWIPAEQKARLLDA